MGVVALESALLSRGRSAQPALCTQYDGFIPSFILCAVCALLPEPELVYQVQEQPV